MGGIGVMELDEANAKNSSDEIIYNNLEKEIII